MLEGKGEEGLLPRSDLKRGEVLMVPPPLKGPTVAAAASATAIASTPAAPAPPVAVAKL
jgi:hypothetical protein